MGLGLGAGPAAAHIYWGTGEQGIRFQSPDGTLGRANLDGTGRTEPFAGHPVPRTPGAIAVSASHIYWTNADHGSIARSNLDGTGVVDEFIPNVSRPFELAVNATHIYWAGNDGKIGRAKLDGTDVKRSFIDVGSAAPPGIVLGDAHVYWSTDDTIGRAKLDGTGVQSSFITGLDMQDGKDLVLAGGHLFWPSGSHGIGRANADGTAIDESFITGTGQVLYLAADSSHLYFNGEQRNEGGNLVGDIGRVGLDKAGLDKSFIVGVGLPTGLAIDGSHLYWTEYFQNRIGRADADGTDADSSFITSHPIDATEVAVSGQHIYWVNEGAPYVGRSNLDGSAADPSFIYVGDAPVDKWAPTDVAVHGDHVYWTTQLPFFDDGRIGRAKLDGTDVEPDIIHTEMPFLESIAASDSHIYWIQETEDRGRVIGRAGLDGTAPDTSFKTGLDARDLAVNDRYLFWSTFSGDIARANLDGTGVNPRLVAAGEARAGFEQMSLAADSTFVYWSSPTTGKIGRAYVDGLGVRPWFVDGIHPIGVAVDGLGPKPPTSGIEIGLHGGAPTIRTGFTGGLGSFSLTDGDVAAEKQRSFSVPPGTYTVTATPVKFHVVTAIKCRDPDGGTKVQVATRRAVIDFDRGESIVCRFDLEGDLDQDGLANEAEAESGTKPADSDSDDDGLGDGRELNATRTRPLRFDTDGDGLSDGVEVGLTVGIAGVHPPEVVGTDPSRFRRDLDPRTRTKPLGNDTDGDKLSDGAEDKNRNGRREKGETDPLKRDTDGDGVNDRLDPRPLGRGPISGGGSGGPGCAFGRGGGGGGGGGPTDPRAGKTVNAAPAGGVVRVRRPSEHRFHPLDAAREVKVGSIFDASDGHVCVEAAQDLAGASKVAQIGGGRFKLEQVARDRTQTSLVMMGGEVRRCGGAKLRARKLSVNGSGRWRTVGRYAYATASGGRKTWRVYDRCDGSTVAARRGTMEVRDRAARRTIKVTEDRRYLASRPGAGR